MNIIKKDLSLFQLTTLINLSPNIYKKIGFELKKKKQMHLIAPPKTFYNAVWNFPPGKSIKSQQCLIYVSFQKKKKGHEMAPFAPVVV